MLAIKSVHKSLRVGGPATCQVDWIEDFIAFAKSAELPLDFISSHLYPTDPNVPQVRARVQAAAHQLLAITRVACNAEPQGSSTGFSQTVGKAAAQTQGLPLLLTEYNAGLCYGGTNLSGLDGAYAAAFVTRQVRPALARAAAPRATASRVPCGAGALSQRRRQLGVLLLLDLH